MGTAVQSGKIEVRNGKVYKDGKLVGLVDENGDVYRNGKKVGHINPTRKSKANTNTPLPATNLGAIPGTTPSKKTPKKGVSPFVWIALTVVFLVVGVAATTAAGVGYYVYARTNPSANTPTDAAPGDKVSGRLNVDYTLNGQVDMSESDPTSGHATVDIWLKGRVKEGEKLELVFGESKDTPLDKARQVAIIAKGLVSDEAEQVVHPLFSVEFNTSRPGAYFALRDYNTKQLVGAKRSIKLPS